MWTLVLLKLDENVFIPLTGVEVYWVRAYNELNSSWSILHFGGARQHGGVLLLVTRHRKPASLRGQSCT